jgi:2-keto-4-pentenoate hydratase
MSTDPAVEALRQHHQRGEFLPPEWKGKLDLDRAYRVQLGLLDLKVAGGERQAGWKVGLTAGHMREMFGTTEPVFGHLLASGSVASGTSFRAAELRNPMVEAELLIALAKDLPGPTATAEDAKAAVATIAPALELVELGRADMRIDLPLAIADNVAQRAFVHGAAVAMPASFDFGSVRAKASVNGQPKADALGREVIDHQLQTLAWLANTLHRYGRRLQAGQCVMTGSFVKPVPVAAGNTLVAEFSGVGRVEVAFV